MRDGPTRKPPRLLKFRVRRDSAARLPGRTGSCQPGSTAAAARPAVQQRNPSLRRSPSQSDLERSVTRGSAAAAAAAASGARSTQRTKMVETGRNRHPESSWLVALGSDEKTRIVATRYSSKFFDVRLLFHLGQSKKPTNNVAWNI